MYKISHNCNNNNNNNNNMSHMMSLVTPIQAGTPPLIQFEKVMWQTYFMLCILHHKVAQQHRPQVCIVQCKVWIDTLCLCL